MSTPRYETAFLFDVDNTLLDNDHVIDDLQSHLEREVGPERARCYWANSCGKPPPLAVRLE